MSFTLSSLDVKYLVKELEPLVIDAFVDKIYHGKDDKGDFLLRLRSPKHGKQQLFLKIPDAFFLTEHRYAWPQDPSGFCMQLRKHLSNTQLIKIEQHGFERIVELTFKKGDVVWKLIIELFSKGNVILINNEGLIRGVLDLQRWKDRTLRVNAPYEYPPGERKTLSLSLDDLKQLFIDAKKELVKFCATGLGLGGKYAEELVASSGLDKCLTILSDDQFKILFDSLQELFDRDVSPVSFENDAAPFILKNNKGEKSDSFSAAIEKLVVTAKIADVEKEGSQVSHKATNKWQVVIDEQTNKVKGYEKSAKENHRKGEVIYEKYQDLNNLFSKLRSLHKESGWSVVKDFVKENNLPVVINEAKGTISFDIKE